MMCAHNLSPGGPCGQLLALAAHLLHWLTGAAAGAEAPYPRKLALEFKYLISIINTNFLLCKIVIFCNGN